MRNYLAVSDSLPKSYCEVIEAMQPPFSCTATFTLPHRNNLSYVHFNEDVLSKN
jgi:hypothetical protein